MKRRNTLDRYWRLIDYENDYSVKEIKAKLSAVISPCFKSALKATFAYYMQRTDRGLLYYQNCSEEELHRFIANRHIARCRSSANVTALWATLEAADEDLTFSRFLELLAELRCRVYDHYTTDFAQTLGACVQPPLSRTCRLVHEEILPLFYQKTVFELRLDGAFRDEPLLHFDVDTSQWLAQTSANMFARTRRLVLDISDSNFLPDCAYSMTLKKDATGFDVDGESREECSNDDDPAAREQMSQVIQSFLDGVCENWVASGAKGLRVEDVYAVRRKMEDALR